MMQGAEEDRLSLAEKRELASALEGLIRDYQELDRGEREDRALAAILHRLGNIRYLLGDYGEARKLYQQSLEIVQHLGDKSGVSRSLHQLGNLAYLTGDYDEARKLYQQSLEINQQLGDKSGVSMSLHQLGILAQAHRRLRRGPKALPAEPGNRAGTRRQKRHFKIAAPVGQSGLSHRRLRRGQKALPAEPGNLIRKLGDKSGVSMIACTSWAMLAHSTPATTTRPESSTSRAWRSCRQLGDKSGMSTSLHQLGNLAHAHRRLRRGQKALPAEPGNQSGTGRQKRHSYCPGTIGSTGGKIRQC